MTTLETGTEAATLIVIAMTDGGMSTGIGGETMTEIMTGIEGLSFISFDHIPSADSINRCPINFIPSPSLPRPS
jgi:hypothetical protein